jgi:hypothetical protein
MAFAGLWWTFLESLPGLQQVLQGLQQMLQFEGHPVFE